MKDINFNLILARELAYYEPELIVDYFLKKLPHEITFKDRKFLSFFDNIFKEAVGLLIEEISKYKLEVPAFYNDLHDFLTEIIENLAIYDNIIILDDLSIIRPYEIISYTTGKRSDLIYKIKYYKAKEENVYKNISDFQLVKDDEDKIEIVEVEGDINNPIGILLKIKSHFPEIIRENIILLNLQSMINYGYYKDSYNMLLLKSDALMTEMNMAEGKAGYGEKNKGSVEVGGAIIVGANEDAKILSPTLNNIHNFEEYVWKIRDNIIKKAGLDIKFDGIEKSGIAYIIKNEILSNKIKPFLISINKFLKWYSEINNFSYLFTAYNNIYIDNTLKDILDIINNDILATPEFIQVILRDYLNKKFPYLQKENIDNIIKSIIKRL